MTVSALNDKFSADQFTHRIRQLDSQESPATLTTHFPSSDLSGRFRSQQVRMPILSGPSQRGRDDANQ